MKDERYQNQSLIVKTYRWIRWKPFYFLNASLYLLKTFFNRNILWDVDEKAYFRRRFIFKLILAEAYSKMKHYYHGYGFLEKCLLCSDNKTKDLNIRKPYKKT